MGWCCFLKSLYGKCKEQYQTGDWKGDRVFLGANSKNDSLSVSGLVVDYYSGGGDGSAGLFAYLCVGS